MEGYELSQSERRALKAIEDRLRAEAAGLDRRLREMSPGPWLRAVRCVEHPIVCLALLLGVASAVLLGLSVHHTTTGYVWGFAACWTATLVATTIALRRTSPRRATP